MTWRWANDDSIVISLHFKCEMQQLRDCPQERTGLNNTKQLLCNSSVQVLAATNEGRLQQHEMKSDPLTLLNM